MWSRHGTRTQDYHLSYARVRHWYRYRRRVEIFSRHSSAHSLTPDTPTALQWTVVLIIADPEGGPQKRNNKLESSYEWDPYLRVRVIILKLKIL